MSGRSFFVALLMMSSMAVVVGGVAGRIAWPQKAAAQTEADIPDVLTPEQMVVVDSKGNSRMFISLDKDEAPMISMHDAKGTALHVISLSPAGEPIIVLNGANGDLRMALGVTEEGGPGILLKNKDGKTAFTAPD